MREVLQALTNELHRLKNAGVKSISVSDESLGLLRRVVEKRTKVAADERTPSQSGGPNQVIPLLQKADPIGVDVPAPMVPRFVGKPESTPEDSPIPPLSPVFTLPEGEKAIRWAALRDLVMKDPVCAMHVRPGKKVVLGVGSLEAKIMFVGEAPGAEEEIQGEPFVGPAGQLLTKMIQAMGLKREEVYIGNIMNWRPQLPVTGGGQQIGNRPPTEQEMRYCLPYLQAQIAVVKPDLLVALGSTAAQGLLGFGSFKTLGEIRGKWREFSGKPLMVTYHPSYILRNQSNRSKRMIWEDLLKVMQRAGLPISERQQNYFLEK